VGNKEVKPLHRPVVILGDKPSAKNLREDVAFVGCSSYKTLLGWIYEMDLNLNQVCLDNSQGAKEFELKMDIANGARIICLGENAHKVVSNFGIECFKLPHPSGLNRKLNDKKWLAEQLLLCKNYIYEDVSEENNE